MSTSTAVVAAIMFGTGVLSIATGEFSHGCLWMVMAFTFAMAAESR